VCAGERDKRIGEKKKIFVVNFGCEFLWAKWSSDFCDFLGYFSDFFGRGGRRGRRFDCARREEMAERRYFGVALDYSASSKYAFKWAIDNIFRDGDTVILVFINKEIQDGTQADLWGEDGSRKKKKKKKKKK
jgi:hypothetical protein